jgi:hypothetical protein
MHEQMDTTPDYPMYWMAMKATTDEQAEQILSELIRLALAQKPELGYEEAKAIQLSNIGYFTGYLKDRDQQRRVLALYKTEHPIFGTYGRELTQEKAFVAGLALGALIKEGNLTPSAVKTVRQIIELPQSPQLGAEEDGL